MTAKSKKHTLINRDLYSYVGNVNHTGVFVRSGSLGNISGGQTGSLSVTFDAVAVKLKRIETFHSGSATKFNINIENRTPNTGSDFDPRSIVACYRDIPGSTDFTDGLDQIEDLIATTDSKDNSEGNLYLKFMPQGAGLNSFKYLLFFEAVFLYVNKDGSLNV